MKVQVITRHAVSNYGSLLQAIATQKIVEKNGCTCEIIDYVREDEHYNQIDNTLLKSKEGWNNNPLKRAIYLLLRKPSSIQAGKKFEKQQKEYLKLTRRYNSSEELMYDTPKADIYMTGSDQVWGTIANGCYDENYFLNFVGEAKKIAFAASFGHAIKTEEAKKMFKDHLSKYSSIAVREDSAVQFLEELDIKSEQVLDPTLIVSASEWRKLIKKRTINKKYVLVYQIHNDKRVGKYAKELAKRLGLPLIRVSASFHQVTREGVLKYLPDISEFLAYIDNAEYLVTDSFHGTAFAINFNTKFVEILPNTNTGSRNQSILKLVGLTDRIVTDMSDFSMAQKEIDFGRVNEILEDERKKSISILSNILA